MLELLQNNLLGKEKTFFEFHILLSGKIKTKKLINSLNAKNSVNFIAKINIFISWKAKSMFSEREIWKFKCIF